MMLHERSFDTGEVVLNYAEGPQNGPPLVVLHGGSGRWQYAEDFLKLSPLRSGWHVFAPDFRGHGKSSRGRSGYRLADYVRDTTAFLAEGIGQPAVVYGHSLGGEVAVKTAATRPDLFKALIVGDAPLSVQNLATEEPTHRAQNELWHRIAGQPVDDIIPQLKDMLVRANLDAAPRPAREFFGEDHMWFAHQALSLHQLDPEMLVAVLRGPAYMLGDYEPRQMLPAIRCPVLLLAADPQEGAVLQEMRSSWRCHSCQMAAWCGFKALDTRCTAHIRRRRSRPSRRSSSACATHFALAADENFGSHGPAYGFYRLGRCLCWRLLQLKSARDAAKRC